MTEKKGLGQRLFLESNVPEEAKGALGTEAKMWVAQKCDIDPISLEDIPVEFLVRFRYRVSLGTTVLACRDVRNLKRVVERARMEGRPALDPVTNIEFSPELLSVIDNHPSSKSFDYEELKRTIAEESESDKKKAAEFGEEAANAIQEAIWAEENKGNDIEDNLAETLAQVDEVQAQLRQLQEYIRIKKWTMQGLTPAQRQNITAEVALAQAQQRVLGERLANLSQILGPGTFY